MERSNLPMNEKNNVCDRQLSPPTSRDLAGSGKHLEGTSRILRETWRGEMAAGSSHLCDSFAINNAGLCGSAAPSFLPASRSGAEGQYVSPLRHLSSISVHCRLGLENCRTAVLNIRN